MHVFLRLLLFFFLSSFSTSSLIQPNGLFKSSLSSSPLREPKEYFELKPPLPSDRLTPSCTLHLLSHDFGDTVGLPPVSVPYSPPFDCPAPWSWVVLQFDAKCAGEQHDRIAAVWLGGAEILRTCTAEPILKGVVWKVRKDVTRYTSLLALSNITLSMMLENVVDDVFRGVYRIELSLLYYSGGGAKFPPTVAEPNINRESGIEAQNLGEISEVVNWEPADALPTFGLPADLVIPISDKGDNGFWFRIQNELDVHSKRIRIPRNTRRVVLELYVSFHGDDEFWYSNPPDAYITLNNLNTRRGHGTFREVCVTIDGKLVASEIAFPVIFTGGFNPLFWQPVVAIGAFDLPSYDIELTPFLGLISDGRRHDFQISVADVIPFWLVDANLHIWLDPHMKKVPANSLLYKFHSPSINRQSNFDRLDGSFGIESQRGSHVAGWVSSGEGNFTTHISRVYKVKSSVKFKGSGSEKHVKHKVKSKTEMWVLTQNGNVVSRTKIKKEYPLDLVTSIRPGNDRESYVMETNVSHSWKEKYDTTGTVSSSVSKRQEARGWVKVRDGSVVSGEANSVQSLSYREGSGCYVRTVAANNGRIVGDSSSSSCQAAE